MEGSEEGDYFGRVVKLVIAETERELAAMTGAEATAVPAFISALKNYDDQSTD